MLLIGTRSLGLACLACDALEVLHVSGLAQKPKDLKLIDRRRLLSALVVLHKELRGHRVNSLWIRWNDVLFVYRQRCDELEVDVLQRNWLAALDGDEIGIKSISLQCS